MAKKRPVFPSRRYPGPTLNLTRPVSSPTTTRKMTGSRASSFMACASAFFEAARSASIKATTPYTIALVVCARQGGRTDFEGGEGCCCRHRRRLQASAVLHETAVFYVF